MSLKGLLLLLFRQKANEHFYSQAFICFSNYVCTGFLQVMENLLSHGILWFHFLGLESHGKWR